MSQISIWPLRKTWLSTWWQNPCWQSQRSDVLVVGHQVCTHLRRDLSHSSLQILSKSLRFWGWRLATQTFSSLHRFSMGLRSGDWLGHSRTLMCFFLSHYFVALAVCFGSLSCWNTHPRPIFNALALTVHVPVHRPFDAVQLSYPLSRKTPPKHNVSTSMFDGGDGGLVDAKELDFGLIWPQHFHPVLLWIICKLQTGLYMCFLEQGDLVGAAGFQSFTMWSVLPIVSWWLWSQLPWDHWYPPV